MHDDTWHYPHPPHISLHDPTACTAQFVYMTMTLNATDGEVIVSYQSFNEVYSAFYDSALVPGGDLFLGGSDTSSQSKHAAILYKQVCTVRAR